MVKVLEDLKKAKDIAAYMEALRRPWNSDGPWDRIRLDNTEKDLIK